MGKIDIIYNKDADVRLERVIKELFWNDEIVEG